MGRIISYFSYIMENKIHGPNHPPEENMDPSNPPRSPRFLGHPPSTSKVQQNATAGAQRLTLQAFLILARTIKAVTLDVAVFRCWLRYPHEKTGDVLYPR
jgi:hypothetical protein